MPRGHGAPRWRGWRWRASSPILGRTSGSLRAVVARMGTPTRGKLSWFDQMVTRGAISPSRRRCIRCEGRGLRLGAGAEASHDTAPLTDVGSDSRQVKWIGAAFWLRWGSGSAIWWFVCRGLHLGLAGIDGRRRPIGHALGGQIPLWGASKPSLAVLTRLPLLTCALSP